MKKIIEKTEQLLELGGIRKDIAFLVISAAALIISMADIPLFPFDAAWIAIILCGIPIIAEAAIGMITAFDIKADLLVSLALAASVFIGEDFAAGEVAFIMQLGGFLEEMTVARARAGIEKLVHLTPQTARVIGAMGEKVIPASEVQVGDLLRVLPGETIPVDGTITEGRTSVNQAVMTGESLPVDRTVGDEVRSGCVNQFGSFDMKAERVGEDSSIQRMIRLVQSADAGKAKIVGMADRWATWVVVIALSAAALTWMISGEIIRAVTILVVFCPCAMVLATPTAIMAAIGNATHHGFLVREGDALERLARVSVVTFDKTGTLTVGTPTVTAVRTVSELSEEEVYRLAAAAEQRSEHPLGKAVLRCWREEHDGLLPEPETFEMVPGMGVEARIEGKEMKAGNLRMMGEGADSFYEDAKMYLEEGAAVIYVEADGRPVGFLALSDELREESSSMLQALRKLQVRPVLLTGDHQNAAEAIGNRLGITEIRSGCLPEDKLTCIGKFQQEKCGVCMIGDGINDAPALKKADVGIAMGGTGSDIAVDAADIALVDDEIRELPHLFALSQRMMRTIRLNLTFSMTLNFVAIALAITGLMGPVVGALVHNTGSVLVIINSAFLLRWKRRS